MLLRGQNNNRMGTGRRQTTASRSVVYARQLLFAEQKRHGTARLHSGIFLLLLAMASVAAGFDVKSFRKDGYGIISNVWSEAKVERLARSILSYTEEGGPLVHYGPPKLRNSVSIEDFGKDARLAEVLDAINGSHKVHSALRKVFGQPMGFERGQYRFVQHDGIGINASVPWHKDRLNGVYRLFERNSPWSTTSHGEEMRIVKVCAYLQDHSHPDDDGALRVLPGTHREPTLPATKQGVRQLHPRAGDLVVFDQRLTHRGQGPAEVTDVYETVPVQTSPHGRKGATEQARHTRTSSPLRSEGGRSRPWRILVTLGYGWNNDHSDDFEAGTVLREANCNDPSLGCYGDLPRLKVLSALKQMGRRVPPT